MKPYLLPLLLLAGLAALPAYQAQAQDKPVLNSAPPGPVPAPPRPADPAPTPTPQPATPEPATTPAPPPVPAPVPNGGFSNRDIPKTGGEPARTYKRKFIYTNFGLGFASQGDLSLFNASAAPALGFRLSERFAIGPGVSYAYSSYSLGSNSGGALNVNNDKSISSNSVGIKAFAQFIVYQEFFLHAEYEVTKAEIIDANPSFGYFKTRRTVTTPLAGIGYRSVVSEDAAFDIVGLYNFDNTLYSLYPGLVLRFSFLYNIGR